MLVLSPLIDRLLRLDNLMAAAVVAATAVPITISGGQIGVLQGERRWWPVAVLYLASGIPRLVLVTALILWRPTELAAIVGVFLGAVVPVVIGAVILRRTRKPGLVSDSHATGPIVREIVSNSQTLLAFLTLSVCDVILARNILDEHEAGLYAGGLILTKAMLFLPQFVVVVAFPAMATAHERRRALFRSLTLVAGLGAVGVLACALLPQLALIFVGGDDYAEIDDLLWMFAVLGTVLVPHPAAGVRRAGPPGHPLGVHRLGRRGRAGGRRAAALLTGVVAADRGGGGLRAVRDAAGDQPAAASGAAGRPGAVGRADCLIAAAVD